MAAPLAAGGNESELVERARQGGGPTLLECRTYRWRGHVGPALDLDVGAKRRDELDEWRAKDPIRRLEAALVADGVLPEELDGVRRDAEKEIEDAIAYARQAPYPDPGELGWYVFKTSDGAAR